MCKFSADLESEIAERIEMSEDATRLDVLKELMQDMDDRGMVAYEFRRELQDIGIMLGIFSAKTREQLDRVQISGGRKKYDFRRGDTFYVFDNWDALQTPCALPA